MAISVRLLFVAFVVAGACDDSRQQAGLTQLRLLGTTSATTRAPNHTGTAAAATLAATATATATPTPTAAPTAAPQPANGKAALLPKQEAASDDSQPARALRNQSSAESSVDASRAAAREAPATAASASGASAAPSQAHLQRPIQFPATAAPEVAPKAEARATPPPPAFAQQARHEPKQAPKQERGADKSAGKRDSNSQAIPQIEGAAKPRQELALLNLTSAAIGDQALRALTQTLRALPVRKLLLARNEIARIGQTFGKTPFEASSRHSPSARTCASASASCSPSSASASTPPSTSASAAEPSSAHATLELRPAFGELRALDLSQNRIKWLAGGQFAALTALTTLSLDDNAIRFVHHAAFANCARLQHLRLARNQIRFLFAGQFRPNPSLLSLDLSGNQLELVRRETFSSMPRLRRLQLAQNRLSVLPPKLLQELGALQALNVSGNQIVRIAPKAFDALNELRKLDLSSNKLVELQADSISNLSKLNDILLDNNSQLLAIEANALASLPKLERISMRNNPMLISVSDHVFGELATASLQLFTVDTSKSLKLDAKSSQFLASIHKASQNACNNQTTDAAVVNATEQKQDQNSPLLEQRDNKREKEEEEENEEEIKHNYSIQEFKDLTLHDLQLTIDDNSYSNNDNSNGNGNGNGNNSAPVANEESLKSWQGEAEAGAQKLLEAANKTSTFFVRLAVVCLMLSFATLAIKSTLGQICSSRKSMQLPIDEEEEEDDDDDDDNQDKERPRNATSCSTNRKRHELYSTTKPQQSEADFLELESLDGSNLSAVDSSCEHVIPSNSSAPPSSGGRRLFELVVDLDLDSTTTNAPPKNADNR